MPIVNDIKNMALNYRRGGFPELAVYLTTLQAECEMLGKNKRNGEPTDEECIGIIKKFINNCKDNIQFEKERGGNPDKYVAEIELYSKFLPAQMSEEDIKEHIKALIYDAKVTSIGKVMQCLNESHPGQFDKALASKLAKQLLG